ncbi:unnamed protein product, partial [Schistosoma mattheei]
MSSQRIPRRALFADSGTGWRKRRGGQCMAWCRGMKESCKGLACVGPLRPPRSGPRDGATHLISTNGLVSDEISARIRKDRLAFANLRHLWRRRDISLSIKGRVYCAAVHSVLIYGGETWPLRVEDTRRLLVFDHRCLRNIAGICWDHRVSNSEVRRRVLGNDGKSVD